VETQTGRSFTPDQVERVVDALESQQVPLIRLMSRTDDQQLRASVTSALRRQVGNFLGAEEIDLLIRSSSTAKPRGVR
jgi:hypothetical protein